MREAVFFTAAGSERDYMCENEREGEKLKKEREGQRRKKEK